MFPVMYCAAAQYHTVIAEPSRYSIVTIVTSTFHFSSEFRGVVLAEKREKKIDWDILRGERTLGRYVP